MQVWVNDGFPVSDAQAPMERAAVAWLEVSRHGYPRALTEPLCKPLADPLPWTLCPGHLQGKMRSGISLYPA